MKKDREGRFTNLDGSGPHGLGNLLRWQVVDRFAGRRRRSPATCPIPRVTPDRALLAAPPDAGARLLWLGHASWLVQLDGVSLLIDPVLGAAIPGVRRNAPPALTAAELPRIDAQLVSHNHYDHLDAPTLRSVGAPVIAGLGTAPTVTGRGLECVELGWWESTRVGAVEVAFVPAQHWSRRGLADTNRALWGGFVVSGRSARLYHSGDTAYFEGFAEIGARYPGIDAAMLPIGAYEPAWFMERQHMNPEQATQAFVDLGARALFAMHWGAFKLTDEPLDEPPRRLAAEWQRRALAPQALRVLAIGEHAQVGGA